MPYTIYVRINDSNGDMKMSKTEKIQIAGVRVGFWERYKQLADLYGYARLADLLEAMVLYVEVNRPSLAIRHDPGPEKENAAP